VTKTAYQGGGMRGRIDEPDRRLRTNTPLYALAGGRGSASIRLGWLPRAGLWDDWGSCPESARESAGVIALNRLMSPDLPEALNYPSCDFSF